MSQIAGVIEQAKRRTGGILLADDFHLAGRLAHEQRAGVAGVREGKTSAGDVHDDITGGGEKRGPQVTEDATQRSVHLREQRAGIRRQLAELLFKRAHHRGH